MDPGTSLIGPLFSPSVRPSFLPSLSNRYSLKARPRIREDEPLRLEANADLLFPEASGLTLISVHTFVSPATRSEVASSTTIFPASLFGVEGRTKGGEEEEEILVVGCARRYKVGR